MNVSGGSGSMWKDRRRVGSAVGGLAALLAVFALYAALAGGTSESAAAIDEALPATVQFLNGSDVGLLTLQPSAIKRLDLRTAPVTSQRFDGKARLVVPYGAVIYDSEGETWLYVSTNARTFKRQHITIDRITQGRVILSAGPAAGTQIAAIGAQELWGIELGIDAGSH